MVDDDSEDRVMDSCDEDFEVYDPYAKREWYILDPKSTGQKIWKLFIILVSWSTMTVTPIGLVFPTAKEHLMLVEWFVDISCAIEIMLCFFRANDTCNTFQEIAKDYVHSGVFFYDFFATFPSLITMQRYNAVNSLKFLRLSHFSTLFYPMILILKVSLPNSNTHKVTNIYNFAILISSIMLFAHFFACIWIYIGFLDKELPPEERTSWLMHPKSDFVNEEDGQVKATDFQIFVFAYYWIWEVITTVGYGDYTPLTWKEQLFVIGLEFFGLSFFSILMGLVNNFVTSLNHGFKSLLNERMHQLDLWV